MCFICACKYVYAAILYLSRHLQCCIGGYSDNCICLLATSIFAIPTPIKNLILVCLPFYGILWYSY